MTKTNMTPEGDHKDRMATLPSEQEEMDEAADTTSPANVNSADTPELIAQKVYTPAEPIVSNEQPPDTTEVNEPPLMRENDPPDGEEVNIRVSAADVDLDSIAVDQDFAQMALVKAESAAPSIGKAASQTWFTPHLDQGTWRSFLTIKDQSDRNTYYVLHPSLVEELAGEFTTTLLVPCMTMQHSLFFWPIKLPDEDGRIDSWNESALEIAMAKGGQWLRLRSNQPASSYDTVTPKQPPQPPEWPEDIPGLLKKAIGKVYVADIDHPLVKRLLGEE